jgi:hypothetical protein
MPHNTFLFHGLALDDDADVNIGQVPGFPDRQCPVHATNLDAASLRPSSKHSEPINRSPPSCVPHGQTNNAAWAH